MTVYELPNEHAHFLRDNYLLALYYAIKMKLGEYIVLYLIYKLCKSLCPTSHERCLKYYISWL